MISVVDYGVCNIGSILNMCRRLGIPASTARTQEEVDAAERLILPGIGAFDAGMHNLRERGLEQSLNRAALERRVPVLGICLGMQLMATESSEGKMRGLGWLPGGSRHFNELAVKPKLGTKFPHIGWNYVECLRSHPILQELEEPPRFYFVHSYCVETGEPETLARSRYGEAPFTAMVARQNIVGAQFHPEKSHRFGMRLLGNFATWSPS